MGYLDAMHPKSIWLNVDLRVLSLDTDVHRLASCHRNRRAFQSRDNIGQQSPMFDEACKPRDQTQGQ